MELKKSPNADLENKKIGLKQIGVVAAFAFILLAFEWKAYDKELTEAIQSVVEQIEEEDVPITRNENTPPPPPPPAAVPPPSTEIEIVADNVKVEDVRISSEDDNKAVEDVPVFTEMKQEEEVIEELPIFQVVEESPEYPGGIEKLYTYLGESVVYPEVAKQTGIQGKVFVTFVVEPNGSISGVKILRGIGGGCDEEAIRVVKSMPKWKPGKQRGQAVRVQYNLPIVFQLQ